MGGIGLKQNELELSLSSGALCMLVPSSFNITDSKSTHRVLERPMRRVNPSWVNIHGQYPSNTIVPKWTAIESTIKYIDQERDSRHPSPYQYSLVTVPRDFRVRAILEYTKPKSFLTQVLDKLCKRPREAGIAALYLSCGYSIIKALAAIVQILYGSYELYKLSDDQIKRRGYAAYQFTVIPYVCMSLTNLIVSCIKPSYPSVYIVHYRGIVDPRMIDRRKKREADFSNRLSTQKPQGVRPAVAVAVDPLGISQIV
ncbi:uncharacterized protein LAJ45_11202 [Morchella importuna]|uniref:uncharacterized protein n=1 Tax=Morchella importuna TaxID=1174673 RepID=UPI001E8CFB0F|nr:uncharacterized protein LAJ45_11221 [Morchella importuna]XP_045966110.1 uncharacterized protein LAJ45_11202 [Morchella importuna]KAH8144786.1 hypothetical protein LAJ45_11221 [Morchella importuna]KAH8144806.1 hypothetical protein LAJ45_11202 [Morchella importuna]